MTSCSFTITLHVLHNDPLRLMKWLYAFKMTVCSHNDTFWCSQSLSVTFTMTSFVPAMTSVPSYSMCLYDHCVTSYKYEWPRNDSVWPSQWFLCPPHDFVWLHNDFVYPSQSFFVNLKVTLCIFHNDLVMFTITYMPSQWFCVQHNGFVCLHNDFVCHHNGFICFHNGFETFTVTLYKFIMMCDLHSDFISYNTCVPSQWLFVTFTMTVLSSQWFFSSFWIIWFLSL